MRHQAGYICEAMGKLARVSRLIENVLQPVGNFLVIVIAVLVFAQVISRYVFEQSYGFMEEFSKWSQIWFVFLLLGVVEKARGHIGIDILPRKLPERYKKWLLILFDIVTLVFAVLLFWSGTQLCYHLWQMGLSSTSTEIPTPLWVVRLCFPIGAIFLAFFSVEHLVRDISSLGKHPEDRE